MSDLKAVSRILGWTTVLGLVVAIVWFVAYMSGFLCNMSGQLFSISEHECSLLTYGGLGLLKIILYLFFFLPWIAIQIQLRQKK